MKSINRYVTSARTTLLIGTIIASASALGADVITTHRIGASLAMEAVAEAVATCARDHYPETAVMVDADGVTIASLRGDGTGVHSLESAYDKAYTATTFSTDTLTLQERAKTDFGMLSKLPHILLFGGGVVIKIGNEVVGAIGAAAAPGEKLDDHCARSGYEKIRDRLH